MQIKPGYLKFMKIMTSQVNSCWKCLEKHPWKSMTSELFWAYFFSSPNLKQFIAARQGGFIVPYVWEIVVRKNLTNFEGCHFARFYILIWWSFPKIETKNFNSGSCFFKLVKLGTISPAAHFLNCVHIGRSQTIAAIIYGLSSGKRFIKLEEFFKIFKLQT